MQVPVEWVMMWFVVQEQDESAFAPVIYSEFDAASAAFVVLFLLHHKFLLIDDLQPLMQTIPH